MRQRFGEERVHDPIGMRGIGDGVVFVHDAQGVQILTKFDITDFGIVELSIEEKHRRCVFVDVSLRRGVDVVLLRLGFPLAAHEGDESLARIIGCGFDGGGVGEIHFSGHDDGCLHCAGGFRFDV